MIPNANVNDNAVFIVMVSALNKYVIMLNMIIPAVNEINLLGQKLPSNPVTNKEVASRNNQVIGIPNSKRPQRHSRAQGHNNGPLTCNHTSIWPIIKIKNPKITCL
jgi:hypothetical protein